MKKIGLSLVMLALAASAANAQFQGSNAGAIPIADGGVPASSVINVPSNFAITGIAVTLNSMSHTWVGDLIITLQAPNGSSATLVNRTGVGVASSTVGDSSNTGGSYRFTDRFGAQNFSVLGGGATDIALAAAGTPGGNWWSEAGVSGAPAPLGDTTASSSYVLRPGDYIATGNTGTGTTYATRYIENNLLAALGSQSNGNWTLSISDHAAGDTGSVAGGWTLQLLPEPTTMSLIGLGVLGLLRRRSR